MSEQLYDIYFRGEALEGKDLTIVKANFAKLFKATPEKVEQLFSGKVVALKKGLDKAGAVKFKSTLESAGAKIYVKAAEASSTAPTAPAAKPAPAPVTTTSASPAPEPVQKPAPAASPTAQTNTGSLDILPAGSDVLTEDERQHIEAADIDTSGISLASVFSQPVVDDIPPPPAPDVSHITAAAVGADVLEGYEAPPPPPAPDVSHISTAEVGSDLLEGYESEDIPLPVPDTSYISVADVGADIDPEKKPPPPPAPDVSHIQLEPPK